MRLWISFLDLRDSLFTGRIQYFLCVLLILIILKVLMMHTDINGRTALTPFRRNIFLLEEMKKRGVIKLTSDFFNGIDLKHKLEEPLLVIPNNLPYMYTPFTGRNSEIFKIEKLLLENRLVTLLGPGGIGKTRISIEVGKLMFRSFKDGVFFVSLENIQEPYLIVDTISSTLKMPELNSADLLSSLCSFLARKELLLIMDNFEHISAGSPVLIQILNAAPNVKVLSSSREILHLAGETVFCVPPLLLPCLDPLPSLEDLMQIETVSLFITRAQEQKPDFLITEENALFIAIICIKLDGFPLAIELAAAQIKTYAPKKILSLLEDQFSLLSGGSKDLPDRQQSLMSAIDWSYNLLNEEEQNLFMQLSIFSGGFLYESVQNICKCSDQSVIFSTLTALYDKSLLKQMKSFNNSIRFRMLEAIKQYAWEKHSGEKINKDLQQRHLDYFVSFAEEKEAELDEENQSVWLKQLEDEYGNLRKALSYAIESGNGDAAVRIAAAVWKFLQLHNSSF